MRPVPNAWLLYLAAFDALVEAQAHDDQEMAEGARIVMRHVLDDLAPDRVVGHSHRLKGEADVRAVLASYRVESTAGYRSSVSIRDQPSPEQSEVTQCPSMRPQTRR